MTPLTVTAFTLLAGHEVFDSPLGSPATTAKMPAFCARHGIAPTIEIFPMSRVNEALEHLRAGQARYRIVLENDFKQRSAECGMRNAEQGNRAENGLR